MPIYEYQCKKCKKISEFLEGVTQEKIEKKCQSCGSRSLEKIISRVSISSGNNPKDKPCHTCPGAGAPGMAPPCAGGACPM